MEMFAWIRYILLCFFFLNNLQYKEVCTQSTRLCFERNAGLQFVGNVPSTATTELGCQDECLAVPGCNNFDFNKCTNICFYNRDALQGGPIDNGGDACLANYDNRPINETLQCQDIVITAGTAGPPGPPGAAGADGAAGSAGATGPDGAQGPQGPQGEKGAAGEKGAVGDKGVQGTAGPPGAKGATGDTGPAGPTGATQGIPGQNGAPGAPGAAGAKGDSGVVGPPGVGVRGAPGPPGFVWYVEQPILDLPEGLFRIPLTSGFNSGFAGTNTGVNNVQQTAGNLPQGPAAGVQGPAAGVQGPAAGVQGPPGVFVGQRTARGRSGLWETHYSRGNLVNGIDGVVSFPPLTEGGSTTRPPPVHRRSTRPPKKLYLSQVYNAGYYTKLEELKGYVDVMLTRNSVILSVCLILSGAIILLLLTRAKVCTTRRMCKRSHDLRFLFVCNSNQPKPRFDCNQIFP